MAWDWRIHVSLLKSSTAATNGVSGCEVLLQVLETKGYMFQRADFLRKQPYLEQY